MIIGAQEICKACVRSFFGEEDRADGCKYSGGVILASTLPPCATATSASAATVTNSPATVTVTGSTSRTASTAGTAAANAGSASEETGSKPTPQ